MPRALLFDANPRFKAIDLLLPELQVSTDMTGTGARVDVAVVPKGKEGTVIRLCMSRCSMYMFIYICAYIYMHIYICISSICSVMPG